MSSLAGGFVGDGRLATASALNQSNGLGFDASGALYISDGSNNRVRRVDSSGIITTIAGTGFSGYSGDGGLATAAKFNYPAGLAWDASGNLFIADMFNHAIRRGDTSGIITTIAGNGSEGYGGDGGPATAALLRQPSNLRFDSSGNLYFSDFRNCRIRKIDASGIITTVAGNGTCGFAGDGGPATSASLNSPIGVTFDAAGNLYIADFLNRRVRKVDASGIITTVAGNGTSSASGDGGSATAATLTPADVATDSSGNLYIADYRNSRIRKVNASGIITTLAGNGEAGFSGDGGPAASARMRNPITLALDSLGNLYFSDDLVYRIRKVTLDAGESITVLLATLDSLNLPSAVTQSLRAQLTAAQDSLAKGKTKTAANQLGAFINHVNAQGGKQLTAEQADQLIAAAEAVITTI